MLHRIAAICGNPPKVTDLFKGLTLCGDVILATNVGETAKKIANAKPYNYPTYAVVHEDKALVLVGKTILYRIIRHPGKVSPKYGLYNTYVSMNSQIILRDFFDRENDMVRYLDSDADITAYPPSEKVPSTEWDITGTTAALIGLGLKPCEPFEYAVRDLSAIVGSTMSINYPGTFQVLITLVDGVGIFHQSKYHDHFAILSHLCISAWLLERAGNDRYRWVESLMYQYRAMLIDLHAETDE